MHVHAAVLNGSVVTALANALEKETITDKSFAELPKATPKIPGNATVRAILRKGDATSASPFASGWQPRGWAFGCIHYAKHPDALESCLKVTAILPLAGKPHV